MTLRRLFATATTLAVLLQVAPALAATEPMIQRSFAAPIDAFSVRLPMDDAAFRYAYQGSDGWSDWLTYESDGDVGPGQESELVMVPVGTVGLRIQGVDDQKAIHPIAVSDDPLRHTVASTDPLPGSSVISRSAWGADDTLLFDGNATQEQSGDTGKGDNGVPASGQIDQRVSDCISAQSMYPLEFQTAPPVRSDARGRVYRWPLQYMSSVKLLVVHHTAIQVTGDPRPAVERVRALYQYHAENRGWGDIGYHYLIDEMGRIYEGRQGGPKVVGGHAYCNNIGTLGIALLGNFDVEEPSMEQTRALQHLLATLAEEEGLDLRRSVLFHGKRFDSPIVGHRDLLSTSCPGTTLAAGLGQIRANVQSGRLDGEVVYPSIARPSPSLAPSTTGTPQKGQAPRIADGIGFLGRTSVSAIPGGLQRLSFSYTAGTGGGYAGKKIADVSLSTPAITLWVDDGIHRIPVTKGILLPYDLPAGDTLQFQLIVQAPVDPGNYRMTIGGIEFSMTVAGRRARTGTFVNPFSGNPALEVRPQETPRSSAPVGSQSAARRTRRLTNRRRSPSSPLSPSVSSPSSPSSDSSPTSPTSPLRIHLSIDPGATVFFPDGGTANDRTVTPGTTYSLLLRGGECVLDQRGITVFQDTMIRMNSRSTVPLSVHGVDGDTRAYRGTLECRVVAGELVLINELSLEDYLEGLAEEPDSEPYEKQRAFAIAARTYAAFYMKPDNRKFPGKPYDGSDDPATFQAYHGVLFADRNPFWVKAVRATAGQVMTYKGSIIKPPYFSSDDGRTRSPAEAGWNNFPASEILQSKPDPWCEGLSMRGHGVGMSGCGALGQAKEGKSAEQILEYYYPGARVERI